LTHYNPAPASPVRAQRERGLETQSNVIVLVVEDEPVLRMMAVDLVEEAGFKAIEAGKADHAVRILEARSDVRIVFTDITYQAQWTA
jgi:CheY-like chemotaxis protein